MPKEVFNSQYQFMARDDLLTFEEITRIASLFADYGVRKLRLTGGEPLLRKNLELLVAALRKIDKIEDIALTTNASILTLDMAQALKSAGLDRITVSLDAINENTFKHMNDRQVSVEKVLQGIDHARAAGFEQIKVNMVVQKGANENDILPIAKYFKDSGHILRFIEFMDVGNSNGWNMSQVVSGAEIIKLISKALPIEPIEAHYRGEVAKRWRYKDGGGEIGVITSVTQAFCRDCNRMRLSADGSLYTCLFASNGTDLRRLIRANASDEYISEVIANTWQERTDRYSEIRGENSIPLQKVEMSYIGG